MSNRRSRSSRARKAPVADAPAQDVAVAPAPASDGVVELLRVAAVDPSETAQLRALEAGWDELLT